MNYALKTENLTRKYGNQIAVNALNMNVPKGSIYGLLGRNGAGKTTTLRMIMDLVKPTSGEVKIFNENYNQSKSLIYSRIGSIIETPGFYENLTGYENLKILAKLRGVHKEDAIIQALKRVGLEKETTKVVSNYSLGMKQRLGIAAAIMHEPELLILDEPTNGLDPIGIQEMRNFLVKLSKEKNVTILISSHILSEIEQLAEHIGIIHEGNLLEELTIDELREKNRRYMEFEVSNDKEASLILEQKLHIKDYEIIEQGIIRIYSHLGQQALINKTFVNNNIEVNKIMMSKERLEDYFINLIGGGGIG